MSWEREKLKEFEQTHYLLKEKERQLEKQLEVYSEQAEHLGKLRADNEMLKSVVTTLHPDADLSSSTELAKLVQTTNQLKKYSVLDSKLLKAFVGFCKYGFKIFNKSQNPAPISINDFSFTAVVVDKKSDEVLSALDYIANIEITEISELGDSKAELVLLTTANYLPSLKALDHMKELFGADNMVAAVEGIDSAPEGWDKHSYLSKTLSGDLTLVAGTILREHLNNGEYCPTRLSKEIATKGYKIKVHPFAASIDVRSHNSIG